MIFKARSQATIHFSFVPTYISIMKHDRLLQIPVHAYRQATSSIIGPMAVRSWASPVISSFMDRTGPPLHLMRTGPTDIFKFPGGTDRSVQNRSRSRSNPVGPGRSRSNLDRHFPSLVLLIAVRALREIRYW